MSDAQEKEIYDLKQLLGLFRSLCTTIELPKLLQSILYSAMAQMRVTGAGIFTLSSLETPSYRLGTNYMNLDVNPLISYCIPKKSRLVEALRGHDEVFTLDRISASIPGCKELDMLTSMNPTLIVPLTFRKRLNGILVLGERIVVEGEDTSEYSDYEKREILSLTSLAAIAVNNASLVEISSTDMMTHLKFKHYFFNILADRMEDAVASKSVLSVLMFDIDFFKKVNDTNGHAYGDYVLSKVADIIRRSIRGKDLASRYGGEEFTVLLNGTGVDNAILVAERIRMNIEACDFCFQDKHIKVTLSGGVATFIPGESSATSANELVDQADKALYVSKRSGRNRITFASEDLLSLVGDNVVGK